MKVFAEDIIQQIVGLTIKQAVPIVMGSGLEYMVLNVDEITTAQYVDNRLIIYVENGNVVEAIEG